jgi:hypothetical protein
VTGGGLLSVCRCQPKTKRRFMKYLNLPKSPFIRALIFVLYRQQVAGATRQFF